MVEFNIKEIIQKSQLNFERAWVETANLVPKDTKIRLSGKGRLHPMKEVTQRCREYLSDMGFTEMENHTIINEDTVYKQYGPESPVILDRAFYLAKLPRPEIGLSKEKIALIKSIIGEFDESVLTEILRSYKKGEIEGDDFVEELVVRLGIKTEQATDLMTDAFPELKDLKPVPTDLTLRTHMTATWYETLAAMQDRANYPIALFAIGPRYRNEQREDKGHLRVHSSASLVIVDPNMSLEAGREITKTFLKRFGFTDANFEMKKATSKYYTKEMEMEVFAEWKGEWLEIGDIGMYSPISLANFGIRYPVFNAGFGVERLTMVLNGFTDIRDMMFPQFSTPSFDDDAICECMSYIKAPNSNKFQDIAKAIQATATEYGDSPSPCRFIAFEDDDIIVEVYEHEEDKKLVGKAAFNEIYIEDGNILSQLRGGEKACRCSYLEGAANEIASMMEETYEKGDSEGDFRIKMAKTLGDVNLQMPLKVREYMEGAHKKTMVKGPIFLSACFRRK